MPHSHEAFSGHQLPPLIRAWVERDRSHRSARATEDAITLRVQQRGRWQTYRYETAKQAAHAVMSGELAYV